MWGKFWTRFSSEDPELRREHDCEAEGAGPASLTPNARLQREVMEACSRYMVTDPIPEAEKFKEIMGDIVDDYSIRLQIIKDLADLPEWGETSPDGEWRPPDPIEVEAAR